MRNPTKKGKRYRAAVFWTGGWFVSCRGRLIGWMNAHHVVCSLSPPADLRMTFQDKGLRHLLIILNG